MDQQKQQLYQAQRGVPPDTSSTSLDSTAQTGHPNGGDWQEEVYQKIELMKEQYLPDLIKIYQKIVNKLMQHDSLPQQLKPEQIEKLRLFKAMLERAITFLQVPKSSIQPGYKEKLVTYEKQIINFVNTIKPSKTVPQMQQQQHNLFQQRNALQFPQNPLPQAAPLSVRAADQNPISRPKLQNQTTLLPGTSLGLIGSVNGADGQDEISRKDLWIRR